MLTSSHCILLNSGRRVKRTASQYGIQTTTIYTDPDARSQHALCSPSAINLGHPTAYLDGDKIIEAARQHGCIGVHPGYGFVRIFEALSCQALNHPAEREFCFRKKMHRSRACLHRAAMAGYGGHGK